LVNETIALQNLAFSLKSFRKPKEDYINIDGKNIFVVYAETELLPRLEDMIRNIDGKTLDGFIYYLKKVEKSVQNIYTEFGEKLSPFLYTKIYDLKDVLFYLIDTHRFHTEVHMIDSTKFLEQYRAGHQIHNESVMKFIIENTQTLNRIVIEIDYYLRKNYDHIEELFPFLLDYRKTV
ncbi:MAG: hypothetical protein C0412_10180, partial [Flavobacterium sp.]|nr:hypothetical protein [Flavobacterium sp.]